MKSWKNFVDTQMEISQTKAKQAEKSSFSATKRYNFY